MAEEYPGIDGELAMGLGIVIYRWAYVEELENTLLARLANANPGSLRVMTATVSNRTVTEWIRVFASMHRLAGDDPVPELDELLISIEAARMERNTLAHGLWSPASETGTATVQTIRWDRSEVIKNELVTLADLSDLAERIGELVCSLQALVAKLGLSESAQ